MRRWFTSGRVTGLGSSTLKALRDLEAGAHWALAGAQGERAAGNGAAMRAAPLAFFLDPASESDRVRLRDIASITHKNDEAYIGALAVVIAIRRAAEDLEASNAAIAAQIFGVSTVVDPTPLLIDIPGADQVIAIVERFARSVDRT